MLLGMDFLHDCKAKLDLEDGTLSLEGDRIIMSCGQSPPSRKVPRPISVVYASAGIKATCLVTVILGASELRRAGLFSLLSRIVRAHWPRSEVGPISGKC